MSRRGVREASPLSRESPKFEHQDITRHKLSAGGVRASSLEIGATKRGGFLSPFPSRRSSPNGPRATHSLEQINTMSPLRLEVPLFPNNRCSISNPASPTSSQSTLNYVPPIRGRVNFSKSTKSRNVDDSDPNILNILNISNEEILPMLSQTDLDNEICRNSNKPPPVGGIFGKLSEMMRPKSTSTVLLQMNGVHKDHLKDHGV